MLVQNGARVDKWCFLLQFGVMKRAPKKDGQKKYAIGPELLALADAAPRKIRAKDFLPAVDMLRLKGYSWRGCAEWLEENAGIEVEHTTLMRISQHRKTFDSEDE